MIANLVLFIVLELASGFCNNLSQLLGVRALYGICMGVRRAPIYCVMCANRLRAFWDPLQRQRLRISHMMLAVYCRDFSNKAMRSATCWRQCSIARSSQRQHMAGEAFSGLERALQF